VLKVLREFKFSEFLGEGGTKPGQFDMDAFIDFLLAKALAFDASDLHLFYDETLKVTRIFVRILGRFVELERLEVRGSRGEPPFYTHMKDAVLHFGSFSEIVLLHVKQFGLSELPLALVVSSCPLCVSIVIVRRVEHMFRYCSWVLLLQQFSGRRSSCCSLLLLLHLLFLSDPKGLGICKRT